jgi:hypothetical protein
MNKENYNPKVLSTFEIIGCYFIDIFYNHLYLTAQDKHKLDPARGGSASDAGPVSFAYVPGSMTDHYKEIVRAYELGIRREPNYYEKSIKGLHDYYCAHTKFSAITLADFINRVLGQFLPTEYFNVLTEQDKFFFLNKIIVKSITKFTDQVLQIEMLKMVIDNHRDESNARYWVDKFIDILIVEREQIFRKFVKQEIKRGRKIDIFEDTDEKIDKTIVDKIIEDKAKLWEQVQILLAAKVGLEADLAKSQAIIKHLYSENANKPNHDPNDLNRINQLTSELNLANNRAQLATNELNKAQADLNKAHTDLNKAHTIINQLTNELNSTRQLTNELNSTRQLTNELNSTRQLTNAAQQATNELNSIRQGAVGSGQAKPSPTVISRSNSSRRKSPIIESEEESSSESESSSSEEQEADKGRFQTRLEEWPKEADNKALDGPSNPFLADIDD